MDFVRGGVRSVIKVDDPLLFAVVSDESKEQEWSLDQQARSDGRNRSKNRSDGHNSSKNIGFIEFERYLRSFLSSPVRKLTKLQAVNGVAGKILDDFKTSLQLRETVVRREKKGLEKTSNEL